MPNNVPEPPLRVLAIAKVRGWKIIERPLWWECSEDNFFVCWDQDAWESYGQDVGDGPLQIGPEKLTVIPHPLNDQAAVELIQKSKERR